MHLLVYELYRYQNARYNDLKKKKVLLRVSIHICWTYWLSARKSQLRETETCQVLERGSQHIKSEDIKY